MSHTKAQSSTTTGTDRRVGSGRLALPVLRYAITTILVLALATGLVLSAGLVAGQASGPVPASPQVRAEVPVSTMDLVSRTANNSPLLVTDPDDSRFIVLANRMDAPDFGCALHVSGDGGRSWLTVNPVPELPPGADKCYAPEVAFDADGVLYYLFVGLAGAGNSPMGAFLTTSDDRGRSFTAPRQLLGPERYAVRMALDPTIGEVGRIHLVWLQATSDPPLGGFGPPPNPIMAAHSDDGGLTFSPPVQVSDPQRERVVAPALALGPDHAVHVLYYDLGADRVDYQGLEGPVFEGTWSLVLATSPDGGRQFQQGVVVEPAVVPPERVLLIFTMPPASLVADARNGVYVAWHDARNGDWDVFLRRSADGGRQWDEPRRLNDDGVGNGRHQYQPALSVASDGRLDAIFYDRRADDTNRGNDVYYTFSTDRATTFATNLQLTTQGSDSEIGPVYGVPSALGRFEFGSRISLVSQSAAVVAAWTDTRNTSRGPPAQDIFATQVDLPERNQGPAGGTRLGGLLLAAASLIALVLLRYRGRRRRQGGSSSSTEV